MKTERLTCVSDTARLSHAMNVMNCQSYSTGGGCKAEIRQSRMTPSILFNVPLSDSKPPALAISRPRTFPLLTYLLLILNHQPIPLTSAPRASINLTLPHLRNHLIHICSTTFTNPICLALAEPCRIGIYSLCMLSGQLEIHHQ